MTWSEQDLTGGARMPEAAEMRQMLPLADRVQKLGFRFLSYQIVKLTPGVWKVYSTMNSNTGIHSYTLPGSGYRIAPFPSKPPCASVHIHALPPSLTLSHRPSIPHRCSFPFSGTSYKWNHKAYNLLR